MTCVNVFRSHPFAFAHVPLSCVPPRTRHGLNGSIAALMNWIVLLSFLLMWPSSTGTPVRHACTLAGGIVTAAAADTLRVARLLVVLHGPDHVDGVGHAGRGVHVLVVPALCPAEVLRREVRVRGVTRGEALPARRERRRIRVRRGIGRVAGGSRR